jgi:hypothetical protein
MSFMQKIKTMWSGDPNQCNNCKLAQVCLCFTCDSTECKTGTICKKEKAITFCQCQKCDGENCRSCRPDIH